jgi:hypothetical protein
MTQDQETQLYIKRAFTLFTLVKSLYKDQITSRDTKLNKSEFSDIVGLNNLLSIWNKGLVRSKESKTLLNNYFTSLGIVPSQQPDIESVPYEAIEGHMVAELYLNNRTTKLKKQA